MARVDEARLQAAAHAVHDRPAAGASPCSKASRSTSRISVATSRTLVGLGRRCGGGRSSTVRTGRWSDRPAIAGPRSSRTAASTTVTPGTGHDVVDAPAGRVGGIVCPGPVPAAAQASDEARSHQDPDGRAVGGGVEVARDHHRRLSGNKRRRCSACASRRASSTAPEERWASMSSTLVLLDDDLCGDEDAPFVAPLADAGCEHHGRVDGQPVATARRGPRRATTAATRGCA